MRKKTTLVARPWVAKLLLLGPSPKGRKKGPKRRKQGHKGMEKGPKGRKKVPREGEKGPKGRGKRSQGKEKRPQGKEKRSQEKKKTKLPDRAWGWGPRRVGYPQCSPPAIHSSIEVFTEFPVNMNHYDSEKDLHNSCIGDAASIPGYCVSCRTAYNFRQWGNV
jgi:hypothetical protein